MKKFSSMTLAELLQARRHLERAIDVRVRSERQRLKDALRQLETIDRSESRRTARKETAVAKTAAPPRYRNPANHAETWTGRGRRPRWITMAMKNKKKKLSEFLLSAQKVNGAGASVH